MLSNILELEKKIETLEFKLQELYGFRIDSNYHRYWLKNDHCSCPRMDNLDPIYFGGGKIHRSDCPIHGYSARPDIWKRS